MSELRCAKRCYDCGASTWDWVEIERRTSGGGQNDYSVVHGDFSRVPVCADRRKCLKNLRMKEEEGHLRKHYQDLEMDIGVSGCPLCQEVVTYLKDQEQAVKFEHLKKDIQKGLVW